MPARHACAALAVLLSLAAPAWAQTGKRYALLVGVTEYDSSSFATLKYAENDAVALAKVLREAGYDEVVLLTSSAGKKDAKAAPTAANVRAALKRLSEKVKRDDLLLVGLSGHGVLWPVLDEKTKKTTDESFFCPQDARPRSKETLAELERTMIPVGELFRRLDESGAGVRLLLVDACRNQVSGQRRNLDFDGLPRARKGTAVLFSCKSGESAHETAKLGGGHGVFFYHVIQALKGEAKDRRGRTTWAALVEHVAEKVSEDVPKIIGEGAKQTPHKIENIEGLSPLLLPPARPGEADKLFREGMDAYLGLTKEVDDQKALALFEQAAQRGHPVALGWAGRMVGRGRGAQKDQEAGLKKVKAALPAVTDKAEQGDADAQALLAALYLAGLGVGKDDKAAVSLARKAVEKGNPFAMSQLALCYGRGRGVEKDEKEAARWYRKAAEKGYAHAANSLSLRYELGVGVEKDEKEAARWCRKAAEKGDHYAMVTLGDRYRDGQGVEKNLAEALKWYTKAAALGDEFAKKRVKELEPLK